MHNTFLLTNFLVVMLFSSGNQGKRGLDDVKLLSEVKSSWDGLSRTTNNYKAKIEWRFYLDNELYINSESISFIGKDEYALMSRLVLNNHTRMDVNAGIPRASIQLIRSKKTHCEFFEIVNTRSLSEIKSIDQLNVPNSKHWALQDERAIDKERASIVDRGKIRLRDFCILFSGFEFAPGMMIRIYEMINDHNYQVNTEYLSSNDARIIYKNNSSDSSLGIVGGTITLQKINGLWLVASSVTRYGNSCAMINGYIADEGEYKVSYDTNFDGSFPSEIVATIKMHDGEKIKHVSKSVAKVTVEKMADRSPFTLPYYGIQERALKPPVYEEAAVTDQQQESSSIDNLPVWAWLAGAGMAFMITGLIVVTFKRKAKAAA